ncbi:unnamed protein product [Somion occarium]|uniref:Beta-glucuronidase C-terminal domain-containing protein n=1 Tax=Somion occarium TaxID=3059160 RepID=A0ABP1CRY2_9APHY
MVFLSLLAISWIFLLIQYATASVTVYGLTGAIAPTDTASASTSAASPAYTGQAAFNTIVLTAPALPNPAPATQFGLQLQNSAQNVVGLSIQQSGAFYGFSIEMSVVTQVIGINSTFINPPFLNLMSLITQRAGRVNIRVGGNTQETAVLVDSLPDGLAIQKDKVDSSNPTETPTLIFTAEIIYMLANVSQLVNTKWYLGVPMNDTANLRLQIAEAAESILGNNLLGLQLGNEPDLYSGHGHRPPTYSPFDYFGEFSVVVQAIQDNSNIPIRNNLIAPSVATGPWIPEDVWNTGFIPAYTNSLGALAVEHYPDDNCAAAFPDAGFGPPKDPQTVFQNYLTHTSGINIVQPYLNSSLIAQQSGKPFLMFETNSASCGGFPGVSDSFGAALWALDYGLQMAYSNFSGALLHVGGADDTYNPFTPPPTNETGFHQWTIGPTFYSVLAMSETLGNTNTSQLVDLQANGNNEFTPAYAVYEGGSLARLALFNFITDPSGANDYTVSISIGGGDTGQPNGTPAQVSVKYLLAPSVAEKENITWAGQTLGAMFKADGRLQGSEQVQTVTCDQNANTCDVKVPAPGFALVFLTDNALQESNPQSTMTFSTSSVTRTINTATVDPAVLATSNGQNGQVRAGLGSTSKGSVNAARAAIIVPSIATLLALLAGLSILGVLSRTTS